MNPTFEVARETAGALGGLLLTPIRYAGTLLSRDRRLREFQSLQPDELSAVDGAPPALARPLRRVFLSCGDASGEQHAIHLLRALRARHPGLEAAGFGGARLAAEGMEVWEPLADLNVMGFRDVAAQLPLFFRCVGRFTRELDATPPQAVILVDYPGLNRHLLRIATRAGIPTVDYIAPQLWAWAPWRIRDFRRASRLLTILPFEGDWFRRHGASPSYVGHPLGDELTEAGAHEEPVALAEDRVWVGILPGSRRREVAENLPLLLRAASALALRRPEVSFVVPHLREKVWPLIRQLLEGSALPIVAAPGRFHSVLPRLQAAWVASGTALLEVAAHRIPPVLVYGISSRFQEWLRQRALAVPYVGSLNLMAGRELVPEHVGLGLDPAALADDLEARLEGPTREGFLEQLEPQLPRFARPGAVARACRAVEEIASPALEMSE